MCIANRQAKQGGFTLFEILIAMVLFAFLTITSFHLFGSVLDAYQRNQQRFSQQGSLALGWMLLFQDLVQIRARTHRDILGDTQSAMEVSDPYLLRFIRGGLPHLDGVIPGGMQRIAYQLEDNILYRLSWSVLDLANDSQPIRQILFKQVDTVLFEFLNDNHDYVKNWPVEDERLSEQANEASSTPPHIVSTALPKMIRVTLTLEDQPPMVRLFPGVER